MQSQINNYIKYIGEIIICLSIEVSLMEYLKRKEAPNAPNYLTVLIVNNLTQI